MLKRLALTAFTAITLNFPLSTSVQATEQYNCYTDISGRAGYVEYGECIPFFIVVVGEEFLNSDKQAFDLYRDLMIEGLLQGGEYSNYREAKTRFSQAIQILQSTKVTVHECDALAVALDEALRAYKAANNALYAESKGSSKAYMEWVRVSGVRSSLD